MNSKLTLDLCPIPRGELMDGMNSRPLGETWKPSCLDPSESVCHSSEHSVWLCVDVQYECVCLCVRERLFVCTLRSWHDFPYNQRLWIQRVPFDLVCGGAMRHPGESWRNRNSTFFSSVDTNYSTGNEWSWQSSLNGDICSILSLNTAKWNDSFVYMYKLINSSRSTQLAELS